MTSYPGIDYGLADEPVAGKKTLDQLTFADCVAYFASKQGPDALKLIEAARRIHHVDGEIEIDDKSIVSGGDGPGDYVLAWIWVSNEDAGVDGERERWWAASSND